MRDLPASATAQCLSSATFFASQLMGLLYADGQLQAILVIVRLAHDRRFVGGVVLFVVSSSSLHLHLHLSGSRGGIVLRMITKEFRSINLVKNSWGMYCFMLLLLGCGPRYFTFLLRFPMRVPRRRSEGHYSRVALTIGSARAASKLQVRRQRKEDFRNAQSWLRRKKVDLTAESTCGHLSIAPGRKVVVFQSQSSWYRP